MGSRVRVNGGSMFAKGRARKNGKGLRGERGTRVCGMLRGDNAEGAEDSAPEALPKRREGHAAHSDGGVGGFTL